MADTQAAPTSQSNKLVIRHVFPSGQAATRGLLQRCRREAHTTIRKRLGNNLLHTNVQINIVPVVTKKGETYQGAWILTNVIRVRFPSAIAVTTAYEQQRNQQHYRDTHAEHLLSYTWQVCLVFIQTTHTGKTTLNDSRHKAFIACPMFRGKDFGSLLQLFRSSL
jgi:hypothetical protein